MGGTHSVPPACQDGRTVAVMAAILQPPVSSPGGVGCNDLITICGVTHADY
ncbi:hypothetical protein Q5P01_005153 [Channa striata]|uniref:Uncharacterized protein n=1 Tax=Channa striata TaxID=64152 RepID=A0AA88SY84_CHASR|nr:hypothetical protein Q5P01_005153 [Channa striata]